MNAPMLVGVQSNELATEPSKGRNGKTVSNPASGRFRTFRNWYWALVPALAVAAYITALRIGFLADDLVLLDRARLRGIDLRALLPYSAWPSYRPFGVLVTWQLGWQVWGFNPLPFHMLSLLLHAAVSLTLGFWVVEITSSRSLGWLAGALFAVFPAHLEAVGWVAAQWDVWAALFGVSSLLLFTMWWRRAKRWYVYALSLLSYTLGIFSKESLLAFLPLLALSAWFVTPDLHARAWRRLAAALLPFCVVLALNLGLRLAYWGNLGGYSTAPANYSEFFWDYFVQYAQLLLSPINPSVLGERVAQIVGALSSLALLVGLVWYGYSQRRLLLVVGAWIVLAILPVLNLPPVATDLQNNRFLYLPAAGYCIGLAALLHAMFTSLARGWRQLALWAVGLLLMLGLVACWVQLRPWHTTTVQVIEVDEELRRLIPPQSRPNGMIWYLENVPDSYKGAYLFRLGLGNIRSFTGGDTPWPENVPSAIEAPIAQDRRDSFALRFSYHENSSRFHVDYASGITWSSPPPTGAQRGDHFLLWDFRGCVPDMVASWQVVGAQTSCEPGEGLVIRPTQDDAQLIGSETVVLPPTGDSRFMRLRVSMLYPSNPQAEPYLNQWYWRGPGDEWSEERSRSITIKQDGESHVYWTFIPVSDVDETVSVLRFDPANGSIQSAVQWIALDLVK